MKFQIKLQPETAVTASIEYDFQGWGTVKDHKNNIINQFASQQQNVDTKAIDNYCLSPSHKQIPFDESKSILTQLALCEKPEIILTIHPSVRALQLIQQLKENDKVKERVFHLRKYLEVESFAEKFISEGGIEILLDVVTKASGNTKSYGLGALQLTLYYLSGIQIYLQINDVIDKIFNFLDESNGITVNRQVLELLILFTTLHHKFSIKLFNYMQNNPSKGFSTLFLLIKSGDINTQLFSLTLINSLLLSFSSSDSPSLSSSGASSSSLNISPNQDPRKIILSSLDQLQFSSYLKSLGNIESESVKNQVQLFFNLAQLNVEEARKTKTKTQFGMQQPLFYLIQKAVKKLQKKMGEYQKSAEYLPNSCKIPINEYLKPFISLQLVNLHDYIVSASNSLPLSDKIKKNSSKKVPTPEMPTASSKEGSLAKFRDPEALKKHKDRRKSKKLSSTHLVSGSSLNQSEPSDLSNKAEDFMELQENYTELQGKYNSLNAELLEERNKQQEASANVQKLAQVVKLMKMKYDSLKDQKSSSNQSSIPSSPPSSPRNKNKEGKQWIWTPLRIEVSAEEIISKSDETPGVSPSSSSNFGGMKRKSNSSSGNSGLLQPGSSSSNSSTSPRTSTIEKLKLKNKKLKLKKKELEKSIKNVESLDKLSIFMLDSFENEEKSKKKLFSASRSFSQTENSIYNETISTHFYKIRNYSSSFSSSTPSPSLSSNESDPSSPLPPLFIFNWKKIILSEEFILNFKFQFHLPSSPSHSTAPVSIWYPFRNSPPTPTSSSPPFSLPFPFVKSAFIRAFDSSNYSRPASLLPSSPSPSSSESGSSSSKQSSSSTGSGRFPRIFSDLSIYDKIKTFKSEYLGSDLPSFIQSIKSLSLSTPQLEALLPLLGTEEEITELAGGVECGNIEDENELFIHQLYSSVPNLFERIFTLHFIRTYPQLCESLLIKLDFVASSCLEILNSAGLRYCFGFILHIGNFLNSGSFKGRADGFYPESLNELFNLKDNSNTKSLFDIVKDQLLANHSDLKAQLATQLPSLSKASSIDLQKIDENIKQIFNDFSRTEKYAEIFTDNEFSQVYTPQLVTSIHTALSELEGKYKSTLTVFSDVILYFVPEDTKYQHSITSDSLLSTLHRFVEALSK